MFTDPTGQHRQRQRPLLQTPDKAAARRRQQNGDAQTNEQNAAQG